MARATEGQVTAAASPLLPHAAHLNAGSGGRPAPDAAAWQRVLQQADQARWFLGASPTPPAKPHGAGPLFRAAGLTEPLLDARVIASGPIEGSQCSTAAGGMAGKRQALPLSVRPCTEGGTPPRAPIPGLPLHATMEPPDSAPSKDHASTHPSRPRMEAPTSLRIHLETTQNGLRVWLGVDGSPDLVAARAAALSAEIRRHTAQAGVRLSTIVCNGATAYSEFSQEKTP